MKKFFLMLFLFPSLTMAGQLKLKIKDRTKFFSATGRGLRIQAGQIVDIRDLDLHSPSCTVFSRNVRHDEVPVFLTQSKINSARYSFFVTEFKYDDGVGSFLSLRCYSTLKFLSADDLSIALGEIAIIEN